jgi:hypothetical protein
LSEHVQDIGLKIADLTAKVDVQSALGCEVGERNGKSIRRIFWVLCVFGCGLTVVAAGQFGWSPVRDFVLGALKKLLAVVTVGV